MSKPNAFFTVLTVTLVTVVIFSRFGQPCSAATPEEELRPPLELVGPEPEPQDLWLEGDAVTKEAIEGLAGRHWGRVSLAGNRVDAGIIDALQHAASIRCLQMYDAKFSGQLPRLKNVKGLVELNLTGVIRPLDIDALGGLTQLESLSLPQELTLNVLGAREIARLTNLRRLFLYSVNLDDAGLAELAPLIKLEELNLTHTRVTDAGLKVLAHFPKLKILELYRHPDWYIKQQLTNDCLPHIARLSELEQLSLSGKINNEGLPQLAKLQKLKNFSIMGTDISVQGLGALEESKIESLHLFYNQLGQTPADMANLQKLKKLKYIWVNGKFLSDEFMKKCHTAFPDISWGWIS